MVRGGVLKVRQEGSSSLLCSTSSEDLDAQAIFEYFGLDENLERILASIMRDSTVTHAVQTYYGLRVMKQDVWECLLSFAIATNSNIPRIKGMISNLCQRFGDPMEFQGETYHLFPTADSLARVSVADLTACGLGYRARFVKAISEAVSSGRMNLDELRLQDYERGKELLAGEVLGRKTLMGIGPKVADCVLLFSCDKKSAFPIDVWMAKVLSREYPRLFDPELVTRLASKVSGQTSLSEVSYERLASAARAYFGQYAGYAQQYLFHYERTRKS
jgi:N-glycosylase/DNA lyase